MNKLAIAFVLLTPISAHGTSITVVPYNPPRVMPDPLPRPRPVPPVYLPVEPRPDYPSLPGLNPDTRMIPVPQPSTPSLLPFIRASNGEKLGQVLNTAFDGVRK